LRINYATRAIYKQTNNAYREIFLTETGIIVTAQAAPGIYIFRNVITVRGNYKFNTTTARNSARDSFNFYRR